MPVSQRGPLPPTGATVAGGRGPALRGGCHLDFFAYPGPRLITALQERIAEKDRSV